MGVWLAMQNEGKKCQPHPTIFLTENDQSSLLTIIQLAFSLWAKLQN